MSTKPQRAPKTARPPTAAAYRAAFLALGTDLTPTRRRLLEVHYRELDQQLTMSQMAEALGWKSYASANSHYGRLAKLVGEQVGFKNPRCHLITLCTFLSPQEKGDHWLIILRPQVTTALRSLGWFETGRNQPASNTPAHLRC